MKGRTKRKIKKIGISVILTIMVGLILVGMIAYAF